MMNMRCLKNGKWCFSGFGLGHCCTRVVRCTVCCMYLAKKYNNLLSGNEMCKNSIAMY
uniref:Uncharacterized protein n=1 Tax=Anguilla anguilla TaxID=7936 RepID=A0A0E9VL51_ANGAN